MYSVSPLASNRLLPYHVPSNTPEAPRMLFVRPFELLNLDNQPKTPTSAKRSRSQSSQYTPRKVVVRRIFDEPQIPPTFPPSNISGGS